MSQVGEAGLLTVTDGGLDTTILLTSTHITLRERGIQYLLVMAFDCVRFARTLLGLAASRDSPSSPAISFFGRVR